MKVIFTEPFERDYRELSPQIQRALDKALVFLSEGERHPSLRAKKLPGAAIWYARITRAYHFTFQIEKDTIILRRLWHARHPWSRAKKVRPSLNVL